MSYEMKFKVVALLGLLVLILFTKSNAQVITSTSPGSVKPFCPIYLGIIQAEAAKINTPDLPVDLKLRITDVLNNAQTGCTTCEGSVVWVNKICLVLILRTGLNELTQIKVEADARASTSTTLSSGTA